MAQHLDSDAATGYVLSRLTPLGGYCFYRTPEWGVEEPNAPDTLAALESLRLLGIEAPEPELTRRWLSSLQDDDGSYPTLTIGWSALRALSLLGTEPACSATAWLTERETALFATDRTRDWGGALRDALRITELRRITNSTLRDHQLIHPLLEEARDPTEAAWARPGADLETTAIATLLAKATDWTPQVAPVAEAYLRRCEDSVLGVRLRPDARATSIGSLWGGVQIVDSLGLVLTYADSVLESLALLQRADGGCGSRHFAISTLHDTWRALEASSVLRELSETKPRTNSFMRLDAAITRH